MHPNIIFAKFQIHGKVIPRRRNEGKKGTSIERMWCGVVSSIPMQFHFITYGMELYTNDSTPINTNNEQCMCMRASGASELRKFWNFYILKLLFLSIFCRYIHWQITSIPWLNFIWGGKRPPPQAPPPLRQCVWGGGHCAPKKICENEKFGQKQWEIQEKGIEKSGKSNGKLGKK